MKILLIILLVIAGVYGMGQAYDNHMHAYCTKLSLQAEEYADNESFYITALDYKECSEVYDITINANIK